MQRRRTDIALFRTFLVALLFLATPGLAEEELLASKDAPEYASLRPLTNGLSAVSLMWPLNSIAENRVKATYAGLATIISGATQDMTAFEAETFREIKNITFDVTALQAHIMLTMTAPSDYFIASINHLDELFKNPKFSHDWYARHILQQHPGLVTKTRRPENIMSLLNTFVFFPKKDDGLDTSKRSFRFGMPSHIVLRSKTNVKPEIDTFLQSLPMQDSYAPVPTPIINDLPKGVIFAPDPGSKETLIYLIKTKTFDNYGDFVSANLLMDYMGAYQGSEMFRVIRQELRAAYNPTSNFEQIGKNRAILGMSATVLSREWPNILTAIEGIYKNIQRGMATDQGLNNNKRRLLGSFDYHLNTNPLWGASQYMNEYTDGAMGLINFPLLRAVANASLERVRREAKDHLPPFSEYLIILIGGTNPPVQAMRTLGYCEQPLSEPLHYCLTKLY